MSRPARGAWVEIIKKLMEALGVTRRAPQGARGLKSRKTEYTGLQRPSRPARGAWVEIFAALLSFAVMSVAPRKGRVG